MKEKQSILASLSFDDFPKYLYTVFFFLRRFKQPKNGNDHRAPLILQLPTHPKSTYLGGCMDSHQIYPSYLTTKIIHTIAFLVIK